MHDATKDQEDNHDPGWKVYFLKVDEEEYDGNQDDDSSIDIEQDLIVHLDEFDGKTASKADADKDQDNQELNPIDILEVTDDDVETDDDGNKVQDRFCNLSSL